MSDRKGERLALLALAILFVAVFAFACVRDADAARTGERYRVGGTLPANDPASYQLGCKTRQDSHVVNGKWTDIDVRLHGRRMRQTTTPTGWAFRRNGVHITVTYWSESTIVLRRLKGQSAVRAYLYCDETDGL